MSESHGVNIKPREQLWDTVAEAVDAELGSAAGVQDVLDVVATVGHVAASAWMGYVPPAGLDLRGEEGFIEVMRMAFRNVKSKENEA